MPIPPIQKELAVKQIEKYCENKIPIDAQSEIKMKYSVRGKSFTLLESRVKWNDDSVWTEMKIAQMRYDSDSMLWKLYYPDRNGKWMKYEILKPKKEIQELLNEIDNDPICVFWG